MTKLYNKKQYTNFRKQLRNHLTPAEAALWNYLKNNKLNGRKFRRQASIDKYIVDFYCPSEKLAIELDGEVHFEDLQYKKDAVRTEYLEELGIRVLRFENKFVYNNLEKVLKIISNNFITTPQSAESADGSPPW